MALNDISLTSSMRSNLIALQNTSTLLSRTQDRLSTGKKVNTALDNPTNFFAAQGHTQRTADLSVRKDGMTEAVQGVQAANKGITAITALIEAAKGLTQAARSAGTADRNSLASQFNTVLTQITQLAGDSGYKGKNFLGNDQLQVLFNETGGSSLTISGFDATSTGLQIGTVQIAVAASTTTGASGFTAATSVTAHETVGTLTLTGAGVVANTTGIATLAGALPVGYTTGNTVWTPASAFGGSGNDAYTFDLLGNMSGIAGVTGVDSIATGLVTLTKVVVNGVDVTTSGTNVMTGSSGTYVITFSGNANIVTGAVINVEFTIANHMATGGTTAGLVNLQTYNLATGAVATGVKGVVGGPNVYIDGNFVAMTGNYDITGTTITFASGVVPLTGAATVTYIYNTGAADASAKNVVFSLNSGGGVSVYVSGTKLTSGYTITTTGISFTTGVVTAGQVVSVAVNSGTYGTAQYSGTTQVTIGTGGSTISLTSTDQDTFTLASVPGTGQAITAVLVNGVAMTGGQYTIDTGAGSITFTTGNAPADGDAVSIQVTTTINAISGAWEADSGIDASVTALNNAVATLRTQSATLASNLSVVTIRQDFTDGMVNTLLKGADNLTLADMNEEGANMLMLQTRQQLGTTSLKMASDAAQSVLRLF